MNVQGNQTHISNYFPPRATICFFQCKDKVCSGSSLASLKKIGVGGGGREIWGMGKG